MDMHTHTDNSPDGNHSTTVSYTHLDVYKRQAFNCNAASFSSTFWAISSFIWESFWASPSSVSYTHLDVYKRQP